ncbi:hypothetical protein OG689_42055 [Kitasatospora sp. NBC_00240]|uniref:hypothetical protein n=1 Tax=Kitasatospora sp. NBC_00240 TaxID=2903567 RepID=UPI002254C52D|nr:hypothetical protein [Kitasatospora sp. NBC_00240]MCX5215741.1 hypothetical protein [Kitasatospora sp. NBC_00240]
MGERRGLLSRLRAAFTSRANWHDQADGAEPAGRTVTAEPERWIYMPPATEGGWQQIQVLDPTGYDFAGLTFKTCDECQLGLVAKIRVSDSWQRRGYGTRMMLRAMRDCGSHSWTTSPQSDFGKRFFLVMAKATGAAFTIETHQCEHMRAAHGGGFGPMRQENRPPLHRG